MNRFAAALPGRRALYATGLALGTLVASPVWAQMGGTAPVGTTGKAGMQKQEEKPQIPPPDAVPGARARGPVAPATKVASDMQPNEALFDAINRGDIAAARDSLNRGAELDSVNILGMTPLELSVDLGRNDISFMLLSMRGEDSSRGARAVGRSAPVAAAQGKPGGTAKVTAGAKSASPVSVASKPVATPKLFANDGGTPQPNAGFLGFGARSATN